MSEGDILDNDKQSKQGKVIKEGFLLKRVRVYLMGIMGFHGFLMATQVGKKCTKSVHSIPLLKWVFYHCIVHFFYTFSHNSIIRIKWNTS